MNAAWTRLSSSAHYTRGKRTLREDAWRLPDGQDGEITESVSKMTLLQYLARPPGRS